MCLKGNLGRYSYTSLESLQRVKNNFRLESGIAHVYDYSAVTTAIAAIEQVSTEAIKIKFRTFTKACSQS